MTTPYPTPAPRPSNGLGIAAFILSLIGIPFCFLSPIALFLSFIALFKRPRGFAFAGFIVSFVITAILVTVVSVAGLVVFSAVKSGIPGLTTLGSTIEAAQRIENATARNGGAIPDELTANAEISTLKDGWGHPLRYSLLPAGGFEIRSAGADGIFDNRDDIAFPVKRSFGAPRPQPELPAPAPGSPAQ